jgi:hypothetical protein
MKTLCARERIRTVDTRFRRGLRVVVLLLQSRFEQFSQCTYRVVFHLGAIPGLFLFAVQADMRASTRRDTHTSSTASPCNEAESGRGLSEATHLALLPNGAAAALQPFPTASRNGDATQSRQDGPRTATRSCRPKAEGAAPTAGARPLVYREQSFASEAQKRCKRYERRAASSKWLTADTLGISRTEFRIRGAEAVQTV